MLLHSPAWCRIQIGTDTDVRYEPLSDRIPNRIASSAAQFNHILSVIAARRRDKTLLLTPDLVGGIPGIYRITPDSLIFLFTTRLQFIPDSLYSTTNLTVRNHAEGRRIAVSHKQWRVGAAGNLRVLLENARQ